MNVLVIGAGGFLGRHLCAGLQAAGMGVVRASSETGTGIDPSSGLLSHVFTVPRATDTVVYLAQSPHTARMPEMAAHLLAVNTLTPVRAAVLAAAAGAKRFIYASTGSVYQPSFSPLDESAPTRRDNWYSLSKVHAEEALGLLQDVMDVTSVRIFGMYGADQTGRLVPNLIRAVSSRDPVSLEPPKAGATADGGLRISLLHVRDAVALIRGLLGVRGVPLLNLASDEALDIREMCTLIGATAGIAPQFITAPRARHGNMVADISLLRRTLAPTFTSFRTGIAELFEKPARVDAQN